MSSGRRWTLVACLLCAPGSARATDLFGGYSVLRLEGQNAHGAALALSFQLGHKLRIAAEATGQSGLVQGEHLREWALLAGPVLAPWRQSWVAPFVHAKAGLVRSRRQLEVFGVTLGAAGVCNGGCPSETVLAAELGGGLDFRLTSRLALRLPQVDYRLTRLDTVDPRRLRFSAGVALRWGR